MTILEEIVKHGEFFKPRWIGQIQVFEFYFKGGFWAVWYSRSSEEWITEFIPY